MIVPLGILAAFVWFLLPRPGGADIEAITAEISPTTPVTSSSSERKLFDPISGWKERITKKEFGKYVNPQDSPVSPEKFTGYHTAVDIEYADTTSDVPVFAIADGEVLVSRFATGYGGVVMISHTIDGRELFAVYGHLRVSSMPAVGKMVSASEQIGLLGTEYSTETDGERRHLHFGVAVKNSLLGYVLNTADLAAGWIDPLTLYK